MPSHHVVGLDLLCPHHTAGHIGHHQTACGGRRPNPLSRMALRRCCASCCEVAHVGACFRKEQRRRGVSVSTRRTVSIAGQAAHVKPRLSRSRSRGRPCHLKNPRSTRRVVLHNVPPLCLFQLCVAGWCREGSSVAAVFTNCRGLHAEGRCIVSFHNHPQEVGCAWEVFHHGSARARIDQFEGGRRRGALGGVAAFHTGDVGTRRARSVLSLLFCNPQRRGAQNEDGGKGKGG